MLKFILKKIIYLSLVSGVIFTAVMPLSVMAQNNIPLPEDIGSDESCEHITQIVEKTFSLPEGLLTAITRIEAGRMSKDGSRKGWPWTINHAGKGLFFNNKDEMLAYAEEQLVDGDQNMDIGCMQISHYWHSENFFDLEEMADPFTNIAYAAAFLSDLEATHGSWDQAIRHYHSSNPNQNTPYVKKVYTAWDDLGSLSSNKETNLASISTEDSDDSIDILPSTASLDAFPIDITDPDITLPDMPIQPTTDHPVLEQPASSDTPVSAMITSEPVEGVKMVKPHDPLAILKAKQPHLRGKWDKVDIFRELLKQ